jgi:predicted transcriptional regulator of viral defense system
MSTRSQNVDRTELILEIVEQAGLLRPRNLDAYGIPRIYLSCLCERGLLQRLGRGLYVLPNADVSKHHSLANVMRPYMEALGDAFAAQSFDTTVICIFLQKW